MSAPGKLRALLATARVANIPSVISNVWCGMALALVWGDAAALDASVLILVPLAGILLYVSGNFLNDWFDRDWDATHRPERALPGGLWQPAVYLAASILLGTSGVAVALAAGVRPGAMAAIIATMVVVYTLIHKRSVWSVLPMGFCRAGLPLMGAFAVLPVTDALRVSLVPALALLGYIAGLSLEARNESLAAQGRTSSGIRPLWLMGLALPLSLLWAYPAHRSWQPLIALVPFVTWLWLCATRWRRPVPRLVSSLLAGIPLVDWVFLLPLALVAPGDALGISMLAVPPLAMASAILLQRLAPAT